MIYHVLDNMPDIEVCRITVSEFDNDFIDTFLQKSKFESRSDLLQVLEVERIGSNQSIEPYEYIPKAPDLSRPYRSSYVKHAGSIEIN